MFESQATWLRTVAVAALGALVCGAMLVVAYANHPGFALTEGRGPALPTRGFYAVEQGNGFTFTWTRAQAQVTVPDLDRRVPWHLTATLRTWRPDGVDTTVRIAVDGVVVFQKAISPTPEAIDVVVPPRPGKDGATISIDTTPTFVPGPADARELGVALEAPRIAPGNEWPRPPRAALVYGMLSVLTLGVALGLIGLPWLWTLAALSCASAAEASLFMRGLAAHGAYPLHTAVLALGLGLGALVVVRTSETVSGVSWSRAARSAVALSAFACFMKLLILLHPTAPVGDGVFHAHRFEWVLGGRFYFTSIAPGNYAFPYPILLYVVSAPFSFFAHDTLQRVALLRIVVTAADACAGALLYWMVTRSTGNRAAGIGAVAWYHLIPMTAWIMTWGNLTNAFGQTLFVASLATLVALPVERRRGPIVWLGLLTAGALLSHPSTCAILAIVLVATAGLYAWRRGPLADAAIGVSMATVAAGLFALLVYYAWFPSLYVRELSRVAAESGTHLAAAASDSTLQSRLALVPTLFVGYLGWPALLAAAVGAWRLAVEGDARLKWLLAAWTGACLVFVLIGIVTPVQMRTHFALFPALAVSAAFACVWAWRGALVLRLGAVAVVGAAAWLTVEQWVGLFG